MKNFIVVLLSVLSFAGVTMAQTTAASGAKIKFMEESKNFGDIKQGEVVKHVFNFKNEGNEPLILSNVSTTCGCTASNWPKEPIAPGKTASIEATFNSAGKAGQQNKVLTVFSNSATGEARVSIICNVVVPSPN